MKDETGKFIIKQDYKDIGNGVFIPSDAPQQITKCKECGVEVDTGDAVILEAPVDYIDKHINDNAEIVMAWHRSCFEKRYTIILPIFKG